MGEDIKMICESSKQSIWLCNDAYERLQDDDKCARAVEDKSRRACKGTCKAKFFAVVNYCLDTVRTDIYICVCVCMCVCVYCTVLYCTVFFIALFCPFLYRTDFLLMMISKLHVELAIYKILDTLHSC